ncbi:hypothetical protein [uncultured Chryseobacterium sp.]|uniref:hypothetical protein n=1 Tax=uncultured Chryseobacterium sp. TaxID=259322 RepID=UPI0025D6896E|nr:hypothetical protein [uncultured Chryseobacterium sp.]
MKKTLVFGAILFSMVAFGQKKTIVLNKVGNDKDAHGCKGSAGYTYSQIKHDCIRTFDQKIKLKEVKPAGTATFMSSVIFSKDMKQAEIFLPSVKSGSMILTRQAKTNNWKNGSYILESYQKDRYRLKKDNKTIYEQM